MLRRMMDAILNKDAMDDKVFGSTFKYSLAHRLFSFFVAIKWRDFEKSFAF